MSTENIFSCTKPSKKTYSCRLNACYKPDQLVISQNILKSPKNTTNQIQNVTEKRALAHWNLLFCTLKVEKCREAWGDVLLYSLTSPDNVPSSSSPSNSCSTPFTCTKSLSLEEEYSLQFLILQWLLNTTTLTQTERERCSTIQSIVRNCLGGSKLTSGT